MRPERGAAASRDAGKNECGTRQNGGTETHADLPGAVEPGADCIARRSPQYALAAGRTRPEVFRKSDAMGLIDRLLGRSDDRETAALYAAIVARERVQHGRASWRARVGQYG